MARTAGGLSPLVSAEACQMAKRRVRVQHSSSYAGARAPRGGVTRQGVVLQTFSHFLIVNKTSLSLSRSLALSLSLARSLALALAHSFQDPIGPFSFTLSFSLSIPSQY